MTNEEKYKDALEKATVFYETKSPDCLILESIFPELAESEDEKIRKAIISFFETMDDNTTYSFIPKKSIISWLEKQCEQKPIEEYNVPDTPIKDSEEVTSRMKYIDENLKPIAEFVMDYASWDLRKDEWNHPVATVPLFRVLDALVQNGKQYSEEYSVVDNNTEPKFEVGDVMRTLQEAVDNITGGLPVVVHIGKKYYHCTNELIAIKNQDDYEYPPTNRRQKPDVSLEPKFKVGDWVVFNNCHQSIYQVEKIEDGYYILRHTHGGTFRVCILHDENLRLWTIEDAKDGDVLYFDDDTIVMFKNLYNSSTFHSHCHIEYGLFGISDDLPDWWESEGFHPSTKEQRDILFQKIKEVGYEWDSKMKQLIKL